ncbi:hypothetical protein OG698_01720 [Streptomyces sp. NBC_01003]|uniref:hypothetical protein n=1 Tax=Streptomyces sp. NBC_01003 TaxID=2903714 RepID=UPI003864190A|nr:hypothetical protein OG698_01720 [Streptomyces sp. NBC_01003]
MSGSELSDVEYAFVLDASEIDILPGVRGDLEEPLASAPAADLAPMLLALVDRGMVEVCRYIPWTTPDGATGYQPGPAIPREDLADVLAAAEEWDYPDDFEWLGRLTLTPTESYRRGR